MKRGYLLLFDESGDLGKSNQSSDYFLLGGIYLNSKKELKQFTHSIKSTKKQINYTRELKGNKLKCNTHFTILKQVGRSFGRRRLSKKVIYLVIDKHVNYGYLLQRLGFLSDKKKKYIDIYIYSTLILFALDALKRQIRSNRLTLLLDNHDRFSEPATSIVQQYLAMKSNWNVIEFTHEIVDSRKSDAIQFADLVANAKFKQLTGKCTCPKEGYSECYDPFSLIKRSGWILYDRMFDTIDKMDLIYSKIKYLDTHGII